MTATVPADTTGRDVRHASEGREASGRAGCPDVPTYDDGDRLVDLDGRRYRYKGDYPTRINPAVLADFAQAQARFDRLAQRVPLDEPWKAPKAASLDAQSL